jgi:hypothetical protein
LLKLECTGRQATVFYITVLGLSLFFILVNWPLFPGISSLITTTRYSFRIVHFIEGQLDLKAEGVLATWYSSIILFIAAAAALLNWRTGPVAGWSVWPTRAGWLLLALVLVGLSADEVAQVHESLASLVNSASDGVTVRIGPGDWVPILLPFIASVALFMVLFILIAIRKSKLSMALGLIGVACWAGAISSEAAEGHFLRWDITYGMRGFIEESFELFGTTSLLISFLEFHRRHQLRAERSKLAPAAEPGGANEPKVEASSEPEPAIAADRPANSPQDRDSVGSEIKM